MTDLSRKVAEVMGWQYTPSVGGVNDSFWTSPDGEEWWELPDYAHDLNLAMEFAETWKGCFRIDRVDHGNYKGHYVITFVESWHPWWAPWRWKEHKAITGQHKDLATAICKARLRALGG